MAEPRDEFPNNFAGDLVRTERGWVVVPPTYCPDGHSYSDGGWSVSSVWCTCNGRHTAWRCHCGAALYAPKPGPHCRIRDRSPVTMHEDLVSGHFAVFAGPIPLCPLYFRDMQRGPLGLPGVGRAGYPETGWAQNWSSCQEVIHHSFHDRQLLLTCCSAWLRSSSPAFRPVGFGGAAQANPAQEPPMGFA